MESSASFHGVTGLLRRDVCLKNRFIFAEDICRNIAANLPQLVSPFRHTNEARNGFHSHQSACQAEGISVNWSPGAAVAAQGWQALHAGCRAAWRGFPTCHSRVDIFICAISYIPSVSYVGNSA